MIDDLADVGRRVIGNVDAVNILQKLAEPLVDPPSVRTRSTFHGNPLFMDVLEVSVRGRAVDGGPV